MPTTYQDPIFVATNDLSNQPIVNGTFYIDLVSDEIYTDFNGVRHKHTSKSEITTLNTNIAGIPIVQQPFTADYNDSTTFTLPKIPDVIMEIWVYQADPENTWFLQIGDWSNTVGSKDVTINKPTLSSGMKVRINYTSKE